MNRFSLFSNYLTPVICPTHVGMNRSSNGLVDVLAAICPTHVGMNRESKPLVCHET